MPTTQAEATAYMKALSEQVAASPALAAIVGNTGFDLRVYGESAGADKIAVNKFWALYGATNQNSPQRTLGPVRRRLFTTVGTLTVLVHAPMRADGLKQAQDIATLFRNAYRDSKSSIVWFRRARINDQPRSDQGQYRCIAQADFEFTERG